VESSKVVYGGRPRSGTAVHSWLSYRGAVNEWGAVDGIVEFPDGKCFRGTAVRRPRRDVPVPDFAVYLLGRDPQVTGWPNQWVRWRDFRLPDSTEDAVAALRAAHTRAASERVEIACGGGIGRTGTALSVLAVMSGIRPDDAIAWVRANYHPRAVETRRQRQWVETLAEKPPMCRCRRGGPRNFSRRGCAASSPSGCGRSSGSAWSRCTPNPRAAAPPTTSRRR